MKSLMKAVKKGALNGVKGAVSVFAFCVTWGLLSVIVGADEQ